MAFAGRWAFASKRMAIPDSSFSARPAKLASLANSFREIRVLLDSLLDCLRCDAKGFSHLTKYPTFCEKPNDCSAAHIELHGAGDT